MTAGPANGGPGEGRAASGGRDSDEALLSRAVLRLNGSVLGLVLGILGAGLIFVMTNWLVIKGGDQVGPHLALLSQFFIGYRVSFLGSLIGAAYTFVAGYVAGRIIAGVYNRIVDLRYR